MSEEPDPNISAAAWRCGVALIHKIQNETLKGTHVQLKDPVQAVEIFASFVQQAIDEEMDDCVPDLKAYRHD